jgi:integrase
MRAERWLANERDGIERATEAGGAWLSVRERAERAAVVRETLSQFGWRWIAQRTIKPRTRIHYETIFREHIEPKLGTIAIANLTPQTIRNWYATTLVDRPTYRSHAYGLLKSILETAVKDGLLTTNPCQITGAGTSKTKTAAVIPSVAELTEIAEKIEPKFKALILISAWCGLRFGEVTELRRKDIGDNAEIISVARGATHRTIKQAGPGGSRCMISTPKNGKPRTVVVPPHVRPAIIDHLANHVGNEPDSLLFAPVRGGCHLSDKVIRDALAPTLKSVGLHHVRIHDLRHFAGSQVARVGNVVETMNHLGHSSVSASLRYQHMVSGRDIEIAEALSALATTPKLAVVADRQAEAAS